ncbi:MAG TPA: geranylgeranylglyceryl/heptaprenylglyceryl phosphate synthase [Chitinophagales bacterium]|jgi:phosphoglycerol geranylgeranyltransferase|nr:geranylgeranylglyceryl/heptaprenylglyceryl phosphate synthase [Chitinophagales bacterium]MBP6154936.1 geranylgeranylglyceryl/heptaprenylglyceryl phosphate synthase [Chitinophagales bacterium]HQV76843.1 geranylgeranylglyceryl/heptaprenylglyceryl phosphate synthase [Chitinophagales bacterium]HQW78090.1 geranylgeranylglyceryl/heptaprenylglyceryl phosphate synthase [Chitinophagales bacterium]HRB68093.1 geranylgeranylglyceryl/heptaprenylglyceryl phosphate synthase [Chitinophagales bacterium]
MKLSAHKKQIAVLIDPDKMDAKKLLKIIAAANHISIDFFLIGGSLILKNNLETCIQLLKKNTSKKVYLFPGNPSQISSKADGILLLSLISGRNAELLIGNHVQAAPILKQSKLHIIPTGYILIESGMPTTVSYISNTTPIPANKPEIAACTALAGEQLGLQCIYLEAGSGAQNVVPISTIKSVRKQIKTPLIVGGGIQSAQQIEQAFAAGADVVVIGTAIENDINFLDELKYIKK